MKNALLSAAVSAFTLTLGLQVHAQESQSWNMATPWSGGPLLERDARGFADQVNTLTDGRFEIEVFPGGTLGSALRVTNTVKSGVAQMGHNFSNYDYGTDPTASLFAGHPSGMTPEEFMLWIYAGGGFELYEEYRLDVFDVVAFPCSVIGTEIFLHSNRPVETLEDFQGLRLRTSGAWSEIASRLGASPVVMAGGEIYSALERGVIDATEWSNPEQNLPAGFHEVAQYIVVPGIHQPGGVTECQFNRDVWEELSERDQELMRAAAKMNVYDTYIKSAYNDLDVFQQYKDGPNEIVQLDSDFINSVMEETEKWEDEMSEENVWFERVVGSQRSFKDKMKLWPEYRIPIGTIGR